MTKLDQYASIQALVQKEIRDMATKIANEVYDTKATQYGVADIPFHIQNGIDSPKLDGNSLKVFSNLSTSPNGVINSSLLNQQEYSYLGYPFNAPSAPPIYVAPLPIIQGIVGGNDSFGGGEAPLGSLVLFFTAGTFCELWARIDDIQTVTLTGGPTMGATSATLDVAWPAPTATLSTTFSNGNVRDVLFTKGSTSITWTGGLSAVATADIITESTWKGVSLDLTR